MAVDANIYDKRFFENTLKLEGPSARAFVRIIIKHFKPRSVIDVGSGIGIYLKEFEKQDIEILGFDGAPDAVKHSLVGDKIHLHDLSKPLELNRRFDLCLCVEVAEHLPKTSANTLINSLVRLSDTHIFTAATPGQGDLSIGHINEQPHAHWKAKFREHSFAYISKLTEELREEMIKEKVVWWVTKNLMLFQKDEN